MNQFDRHQRQASQALDSLHDSAVHVAVGQVRRSMGKPATSYNSVPDVVTNTDDAGNEVVPVTAYVVSGDSDPAYHGTYTDTGAIYGLARVYRLSATDFRLSFAAATGVWCISESEPASSPGAIAYTRAGSPFSPALGQYTKVGNPDTLTVTAV